MRLFTPRRASRRRASGARAARRADRGRRPTSRAISSTIQRSCSSAIAWNALRPAGVSETACARRSPGTRRRSTSPSPTSWSVRPVTLPPVTISRRDSSLILRPAGCALELRHQVEARQRHREAVAQPALDAPLDQQRAGEQAQPQPKRVVMIVVQPAFRIRRRDVERNGGLAHAAHWVPPPG